MQKKPELTVENVDDAVFEMLELGRLSIVSPVEHDGHSLVLINGKKGMENALVATISPGGVMTTANVADRPKIIKELLDNWKERYNGSQFAARIKKALSEN